MTFVTPVTLIFYFACVGNIKLRSFGSEKAFTHRGLMISMTSVTPVTLIFYFAWMIISAYGAYQIREGYNIQSLQIWEKLNAR